MFDTLVKNKWNFRIIICFLLFFLFTSKGISQPGSAVVKSDELTVYSKMSAVSKVVKTINKGETVIVRLELMGSGGSWCGITQGEEQEIIGFVKCEHLESGITREEEWQLIDVPNATSGNRTTKVTINGNQVLVPVTVTYGRNRVQISAILDTGASMSVISAEIASKLKINLDRSKKALHQVVGGSLVEATHIKLSSIKVGPHKKRDMKIAVIEQKAPAVKHDGLLGMDFLRDLKYHVDFKNHTIKWALK